jgi:hypothetical protein
MNLLLLCSTHCFAVDAAQLKCVMFESPCVCNTVAQHHISHCLLLVSDIGLDLPELQLLRSILHSVYAYLLCSSFLAFKAYTVFTHVCWLLVVVLQVSDIGLDLPELQLLLSRLQQGDALQEQLDDLLAASGEERASINTLKALQQHASSCGLALSGVSVCVCVRVRACVRACVCVCVSERYWGWYVGVTGVLLLLGVLQMPLFVVWQGCGLLLYW